MTVTSSRVKTCSSQPLQSRRDSKPVNTEDIKLFHKIVQAGSLTETAEQLQQPKSTLSRRVKAMEQELGTKLFHRNNRNLLLTGAGESFYSNTQQLIADYNTAVAEITNTQADIKGKVRIQTFPLPMLEHAPLMEAIFSFMELHPNIKVDIMTSSEPLDISGNNFDLAFWVEIIFEHPDMVSRPIAESHMYYFASPQYLAAKGTPSSPTELVDHSCIHYYFNTEEAANNLPIDDNRNHDIKVPGTLCTNNVEVAKHAAISGKGIAFLPNEWCQKEMVSKKLVRLFGPEPILVSKLNLVYPSRKFVSIAAQRFIDFIMEYKEKHGPFDLNTEPSLRN